MRFEAKGYECAFSNGQFSYKGPRSLFKQGELIVIDDVTYIIQTINKSAVIPEYMTVQVTCA